MTDNPLSNIPGRITASAEMLEAAVVELLRLIPETWQAATGASLSIIGRSLGHKNVATTAVYARLDLDPVRASVNTAADAIMAAANGMKALPAPARNGKADGDGKPKARKPAAHGKSKPQITRPARRIDAHPQTE